MIANSASISHQGQHRRVLNVVVQLERTPGARFVFEVSEILGLDIEADRFRLGSVYCRQNELRQRAKP